MKIPLITRRKISLIALMAIGFFYRWYGLGANYSFWTDENHAVIFARAILERGQPALASGYNTGAYQWLLYWLMATSAKIFGLNEFALRLPSVVFGIATIGAVYLVAKEVFAGDNPAPEDAIQQPRGVFSREVFAGDNSTSKDAIQQPWGIFSYLIIRKIWGDRGDKGGEDIIPLLAAFLTAFLSIEILWSRQARPYQGLQFFYLLGGYFLLKLGRSRELGRLGKLGKSRGLAYLGGFLACGILAALMHGLGLVILFVGSLFLFTANFRDLKKFLPPALLLAAVFGYLFRIQLLSLLPRGKTINNLFYYRVFLTHNYLALVILGGLGGLGLLGRRKYKELLLFGLVFGVQGFIVSFVLGQPFIRYFYPVFGFLIVLAVGGIGEIGRIGEKIAGRMILVGHTTGIILKIGGVGKEKTKLAVGAIALAGLVFSLWGKLSILPKPVYSLNADMQEIPEVDWKKVYGLVEQKLRENPQAVLVANWNDLPVWYLGEGKLDYFLRVPGSKFKGRLLPRDVFSGARTVSSLKGFTEVIGNHPQGLVVLDSWDNWVSQEVRDYARDNLKKELEVDRVYPKQPRYWPVSVYSWGME